MSERNAFRKQNTNKSSKNVEHTQTKTMSTCTYCTCILEEYYMYMRYAHEAHSTDVRRPSHTYVQWGEMQQLEVVPGGSCTDLWRETPRHRVSETAD